MTTVLSTWDPKAHGNTSGALLCVWGGGGGALIIPVAVRGGIGQLDSVSLTSERTCMGSDCVWDEGLEARQGHFISLATYICHLDTVLHFHRIIAWGSGREQSVLPPPESQGGSTVEFSA